MSFKNKHSKQEGKAIIIIGPPGGGKGTQKKKIIEYLNRTGLQILHIETGKYFRNLLEGDSYTSKLTKETVNDGRLMPYSMAINIWMSSLVENYSGQVVIFDGVSRRVIEAKALHETLKFYRISYKVVSIEVSRKWATGMLLGRAKEEGRVDDRVSAIEIRQNLFEEESIPVIRYYENLNDGCELVKINGEGTVEEVHERIIKGVFGK